MKPLFVITILHKLRIEFYVDGVMKFVITGNYVTFYLDYII